MIGDPKIPRWRRVIQKLAATGWASWFLSRTLRHLDRPFLHLSHNRVSLTSLLTGLPVVVLTSTGAKSGLPRITPLVGIPDGDSVVLVASNFGSDSHPSWYYNLHAHPQATLTVEGRTGTYFAREAVGDEREHYWSKAVELYRGFESYRQRSSGRVIPILILSPMLVE
jgi:deazaflavin-dependent oxidoreductase (nitroreductase family)